MAKRSSDILDTQNAVTATELYRILMMQLDAMDEDPSCIEEMSPLFIHGSPGGGKSSVVKQVCKDRGIEFIDFRASQHEPCDIRGLPVPNREKQQMDWYVNGIWPRDPKGKGIIFLDELSSADRSVAVAMYELVLDRRLGQLYSVPPGYLIVAAGNKTTDKAVAYTTPSALANRFTHVELNIDAEAWLYWANQNNIHPAVTGFIMYKPNMLFDMEGQNLERGWPSPRSWARVSQLCHMYRNHEDTALRKLIYGTVGVGAGGEFIEFYKVNAKFADILSVMLDPGVKFEVPKRADEKYAVCSAMVYLLWRDQDGLDSKGTARRIDGFFRICCELDSDFASMAILSAIQHKDKEITSVRANKLLRHPKFKDWKAKHGNALKQGLDLSSVF